MCVCVYLYLFSLPDTKRAEYDTKSILKRGKTAGNSLFSFFYTGYPTKAKEHSIPGYLLIAD